MAIALVTTPVTGGVYKNGSTRFEYKDEIIINTVQNNAGDLQLDSGGIGAICLVGQYVYFAPLLLADNVDSAIALIIDVDTNFIVLDVHYSALITAGVLRRMETVEFLTSTGYSATTQQPQRVTQTVKVKPDVDGIYRVEGATAVKSRFTFGIPRLSTASDYEHQTRLSIYPNGFVSPTFVTITKATGVKADQVDTINYTNFRGVFCELQSNIFKTFQEATKGVTTLHEGASAVTITRLQGQSIDFLFDTGLQTVANLSWSPAKPASFVYNGSGSNTDGFSISSIAFPTVNDTYEISNTVTGDTWLVTIDIHTSLAVKESCPDDLIVVWWQPSGGWFTYCFGGKKKYEVIGNDAILTKSTDRKVRAVSFENGYNAVTVTAEPESELIIDQLNTLRSATQIFICPLSGSGGGTILDIANAQRCYVDGGGFASKQIDPFYSLENLFTVTLVISDEINTVNE